MKNFEFPKNEEAFKAMSPQEQLLLEHLFAQRVLQATEELQGSALGMGFFKMPKNLNNEAIQECFRVLGYTKTFATYQAVEKEYEKALLMAVDAQKITMVGWVGSTIMLLGMLIWG